MKIVNRSSPISRGKAALPLLGLLLASQPAAWAAGVVATCDWPTLERALLGGGRVIFACDGTIEVPEIAINRNTVVDARGRSVALSGGGNNRVFAVNRGARLKLLNLGIVRGFANFGGGIYNQGVLQLSRCTLENNEGTSGGAVYNAGFAKIRYSTLAGNTAANYGGGIFNSGGTTNITNSTLQDNVGSFSGGGIWNEEGLLTVASSTLARNRGSSGGGLFNSSGTALFINSTLSGNGAGVDSGGAFNGQTGQLGLTHSTVADNKAGTGGGLSGAATLVHSIVANNSGGDCGTGGPILDGGHNLDSDGSCKLDSRFGSLSKVDPRLGGLADNGGPTPTHALLAGSPALDLIPPNPADRCPPADQRGVARPQPRGGNCDSGAYERSTTGPAAYRFDGFYPPIAMPPAINEVNAGQTIPVKWRLTDTQGNPINNPASFVSVSSYPVDCATLAGDPGAAVIEPAPGASGLQYQGNGYWQFNWKTPKAYEGTCRAMFVAFDDKSASPVAHFQFKDKK